ncbi:MAG: DUF4058 family protein [Caldilineaceae bacterium]
MPSPFPGMDPYLEGYLWPDVHHRLATQISDQITPAIRPRYVARIEVQVVQDETPEAEIGIMYPDVEILLRRAPRPEAPPAPTYPTGGGVMVAEPPAVTPATYSVALGQIDVRLASVHILDTAQNQLVTSIEILSPVNKREPGLTQYRAKRRRLHAAGVHLLEIDLLRRGQRPLLTQQVPNSAYRITLTRSGANSVDVWALNLADPLPVLPVPLRAPDKDVTLDLGLGFATIYERAAYDLSIDYHAAPPPPPFTAEEQDALATLLKNLP